MTAREKFDASALAAVLAAPAPVTFDRAGRVKLLAECFQALMDGRLPSREAALFTAGGALAWLSQGGSLERDYWRVTAPAGSHHTPAALWEELSSRGATGAASSRTIAPLLSEPDQ